MLIGQLLIKVFRVFFGRLCEFCCIQVDSFLIEEGASGSPSEGEPEPEFLLSRPPGPPHSPPQAAEPVDPETQVILYIPDYLLFGICIRIHTWFACIGIRFPSLVIVFVFPPNCLYWYLYLCSCLVWFTSG